MGIVKKRHASCANVLNVLVVIAAIIATVGMIVCCIDRDTSTTHRIMVEVMGFLGLLVASIVGLSEVQDNLALSWSLFGLCISFMLAMFVAAFEPDLSNFEFDVTFSTKMKFGISAAVLSAIGALMAVLGRIGNKDA